MREFHSLLGPMATALLTALCTGCRVGYPFSGPGYDSRSGVTLPEAGAQVVVALTRGTIADSQQFDTHLSRVLRSLPQSPGLIGFAVRRELLGRTVWTLSVWVDQAAVQSFLRSAEHRAAVSDGGIPEGSVESALFEHPVDQIPISWADAERKFLSASTYGSTSAQR